MGSINRKFKKNKDIKILLSTRFICKKCNFEKVIPRVKVNTPTIRVDKNIILFFLFI